MRLVIRIIINAFALWVVSLIEILQVKIKPFPPGEPLQFVLTLLVVGAVLAVVNTVVGKIIKIVAAPLYCLTFGLISFVVTGFLLWLTAWITTSFFHWGLEVHHFGWGIVAALVISVINAVFGAILRPQKK